MVQLGDDLNVDDNHPLVAEISSLRLAVARFQEETHSYSVKLQRQSLEGAKALERASYLERENDALKSELAILRANPHPDASPQAHPAVLQVQQLTLSLRRLSDKLSLTEDALLTRTTELTHAMGEATKAKHAAEGAYELAARTRGREEAGKVRELELEWKVKAAEESVRMSDLVVNEYADLVRALNAKTGKGPITHSRSNSTTSTLVTEEDSTSNASLMTLPESLSQGKFGLQRLLAEFSGETEKLQIEILRLHAEAETAEAKCEAERKVSEQCRVDLANALFELQKLRLEDSAAAKMVSRYMKFSQKSTDTLQDAMTALKARHSANIATLSAQLYDVSGQLRSSETDVERLRTALDDLGGDILKETYGRRREVALRIRMVNREEKTREDLERWILRAEENLGRNGNGSAFHHEMVHSAREMLSSIDGPSSSSGSLARLILARTAVEELSKELEVETAKKLHLEGLLAHVDNSSSTFSSQDATGKIINGIAKMDESSVNTSTAQIKYEAKDEKQLPPDPPFVHSDPPSPNETTQPLLRSEKVENIIHEDIPYSEDLHIRDQLLQANAEYLLLNLDAVQTETQEVPLEPTPTLVDPPVPNMSPKVQENQIPLGEANTNPINKPPVLETSDHEPTPLVTLEPPPPEAQVSEAEIPDYPIIHLSSSSPSTPISSSPELTLAVEESLNMEIPRSPPEDVPPARNSQPEEPPSSSPVPPFSTIAPPPLLAIPERLPHPLLADLVKVSHRYDDLQRAFRDCHLALETLKASMSPTSGAPPLNKLGVTSPDIIRTALERLNDYTEDARVELEIRIADESLMARGFETLLLVPGALSTPSTQTRSLSQEDIGGLDSAPTQSEVERQIEDFISGADPAVEKVFGNFTRKLDDIQHDIAALKRAAHDPVLSPTVPSTAPVANGGWSSWILNTPTSNPISDTNSSPGPAPTFGNVMTTPRLRHSPSLNFQTQSKKGYLGGGNKDAFAALGLKVPMPSYVHVPEIPQRSRTVSTMYMLGLGARRPSAGGSFASPTQQSKKPPPKLHLRKDTETTDDESELGDDDADVE